ncbi:ThyX-like thymidylate synthase [Streptomyces phage Endor2]|uniref:ThyX-like thymidylate synthase n=1 Tax=Streptomyces phage Endor2 TaxID=2740182 RepID=A0A7G4AX57_9CAUD|nr:ThyX-like thymidylate synthase [Streptomyces phage Endor2]QMP84597.1 ThyX-like thymidylate synthase [Streptomyces phage Endor2]
MTVQLIKTDASDEDVARAARVSTVGADSLDTGKPIEGLIKYLMRDRHGSPFEHNNFTFYIEAPIFVAREFFRHRAGWSYNEESARYKELDPVFYVPAGDRNLVQVGKPGAYEFQPGTFLQSLSAVHNHRDAYAAAFNAYREQLGAGVAREVARNVLPVGIYTSFWATCNARSLMHFLSLRTKRQNATVPSFPLREIEMVADEMELIFMDTMPVTHRAFEMAGRVAP